MGSCTRWSLNVGVPGLDPFFVIPLSDACLHLFVHQHHGWPSSVSTRVRYEEITDKKEKDRERGQKFSSINLLDDEFHGWFSFFFFYLKLVVRSATCFLRKHSTEGWYQQRQGQSVLYLWWIVVYYTLTSVYWLYYTPRSQLKATVNHPIKPTTQDDNYGGKKKKEMKKPHTYSVPVAQLYDSIYIESEWLGSYKSTW